MSLIVTDAATADIEAAVAAYNRKPEQYGREFENEVERGIAKIGASPQLYPLVEDGIPGSEYREYFIARFDQRVIYLVDGEDVLVVAVVHASRRESSWHRNLSTNPPPGTP